MIVVSGLLVAFVLLGGVLGRTLAVEGTYSYLKLFNEVLYLIRNNYVEPIREQTLMEGAYRGMLESLDPQGEYLDATLFEEALEGKRRGPADLGLVLSKRRGYAVIVSALQGSPGERADLRTGDQVLTIDGRSTREVGVWKATRALQGEEGSKVRLSVMRTNGSRREEVELTRELPQSSPLTYRLLEPEVALLRLGNLQKGDSERLREALAQAKMEGAGRLILDLRGNAGSLLQEAVRVASLFTGEGTVVTLADRHDGDSELRAPPGEPIWNGPLVLLVDSGTANGAEVLAAAIRDRTDGLLVGERTWGVGSIQKLIPLPAGDGIRISVGKFVSPNGEEWHGVGLSPDVEQAALPEAPADGEEDPQIRKALEVLKSGDTGLKAA